MELKQARDIAVSLCYKLQPFCSQIRIAGSIRRKKAEVKDIEICVVPLFIERNMETLFDTGEKITVIHPVPQVALQIFKAIKTMCNNE